MKILKYLQNRTAHYILAAGLTASLFTGCDNKVIKTELSDVLYDKARVEYKENNLKEENLSKGVALGAAMNNMALGISLGNTMNNSEKDYITFTGKKVNFQVKNKFELAHFKTNDVAEVAYQEMYRLTYEDIDGDGNRELIGKSLIGYKFVDAQKKTETELNNSPKLEKRNFKKLLEKTLREIIQ